MDDSQIDYLLNHLGDSDASIRDGLVYSTLAQGFEESIFSEAQMRKIIAFVTDGECLYYKIGSQADDSVFLRRVLSSESNGSAGPNITFLMNKTIEVGCPHHKDGLMRSLTAVIYLMPLYNILFSHPVRAFST